MAANIRRRSADFQSAVWQTFSLRAAGKGSAPRVSRTPADYKSAIQQIENLRYAETCTNNHERSELAPIPFHGWTRFPCLLAILFCAVTTSTATAPRLNAIVPAGGQRGTELEVIFQGDRLQDAEEAICYEPGFEVLKLNAVTNKIVKAQVRITPDAPLGEHHIRLRSATGVSELRTFFVGPFPVVAEKEPNNDAARAQPVLLNTTVEGVITSEDLDCFAVELTKGQRLSVEAEGMRLGRGVFDPWLAILTPDGSVLAQADDTWLGVQDPFLSLVATNNGRYIIQLREATYGGNENCRYRLHVGTFPRPTSIYPLGGQAGEVLALTFFSETTGQFERTVQLPEAAQERLGIFPELEGLSAPTPNWIRVSTFSNVLEASDLPAERTCPIPLTNSSEHATIAEFHPPLALNGIISRPGKEGWFRFPATKSVALEVNVYARRLRSPLDSVLEIFDSHGRTLAANDDAAGPDSSLKFTPSETTNYFVRIRDTLGQGGRDFTYRIEIAPSQPGVTLKIPEVAINDTQSRQVITVPRGNRFATLISAKRSNFRGELGFEISELPPGVTLQADRLPGNLDSLPLVFEAGADAPMGARLLDLTATGTNDHSQVTGKFHQEIDLVEGPNNTTYYSTSVDKLCIAVTREAPFHLRIVEPAVPLVQSGSMRLEIVAERTPDFHEPIEIQMVWNPPGISSQSEATLPADATNVFYQLNASPAAEPRVWRSAVLGHASVDGGPIYISSQLAPIEIATPFLTGKMETVSANPGQASKLTVKLQQLKAFDGKATARLLGLPEKITAREREFSDQDHELVFDLAIDPNCPLGSYKNLFCAAELKQNGQTIPHTIAAGGILRVVPPRKPETKIAAAGEIRDRKQQ